MIVFPRRQRPFARTHPDRAFLPVARADRDGIGPRTFGGCAMQYLVTMTTHVPPGTPDDAVDDIRGREARRSRELAARGDLLRLWRPPQRPGEWRTLGLFEADRTDHLEQVLTSMPLRVWRTDEVTPLSPHPHDPDLPDRNGSARPSGEF